MKQINENHLKRTNSLFQSPMKNKKAVVKVQRDKIPAKIKCTVPSVVLSADLGSCGKGHIKIPVIPMMVNKIPEILIGLFRRGRGSKNKQNPKIVIKIFAKVYKMLSVELCGELARVNSEIEFEK